MQLVSIHDKREDSKIRWYGHVKRMNSGRIPRQALEYQLVGKISRDWPIYRWEEQVKIHFRVIML